MTPVLIAVDPGVQTSAFVTVAPSTLGRIAVLKVETVESTPKAIEAFLDASLPPSAVAIENAQGYAFQPYRVPGLLEQQRIVGIIQGMAHLWAWRTLLVTSAVWRAAVVGRVPRPKKIAGVKVPKPNMDALVQRALPTFVDGIPPKLSVHARDSLGLAVYASREVWRRLS